MSRPRGKLAHALVCAVASIALLAMACASVRATEALLPSTPRAKNAALVVPARARVRLTLTDPRAVVVSAPGKEPLRLDARGAQVHASDGRVLSRLELPALEGALGWEIDARMYPGRLLVQARGGALEVVNELPLEEYVEGVVAGELVLWSALPAELEAQAIVARTYAVRELALDGVLEDSTADQSFRGRFLPARSPAAQVVAQRLTAAVRATRGMVLALDGALLDARFHAACGGSTAELADVFPTGGRACAGVRCDPCTERAHAELATGARDADRPLSWSYTASRADLTRLARTMGLGDRLSSLAPSRRDSSGRWLEVEVRGNAGRGLISLPDLRERLGQKLVLSGRILRTWPAAGQTIDAGMYFEGIGRGHGVGLCQEGTHDYAQRGLSAVEILAHYYPGAHAERAALAGT